ncbi:MAG TPA: hypothetical protein VH682_27435 [Gemmataceae bacterium]|jgi:hypothetical protein
MSTTNPLTSSAALAKKSSLTIIGHSDLFYWWPVWVVGFLMAFATYLSGYYMAFVPAGTVAEKARQVQGVDEPRDVLILPANRELPLDETAGGPGQPSLRVARSNNLGSLFVTVLLLVIFITNVRLSGVRALVLITLVLLLAVIFAVTGIWDLVFRLMGSADIHITAAGYLCIATPLFVIWLVVFLFYDRLNYARFSRGQFTIHHAFGAGATTYEVQGLSLEKKRDDLFRHWLLGIGSGDLVIRTGGPHARTFELPNVLFVGSKLVTAQRLLQERQVVNA